MHLHEVVALGDKLQNGEEGTMKKVIATLTAIGFVLSLAGAGLAQTAAKEAEKGTMKKEASAAPAQVAPTKPEVSKPAVKEEVKPGEKAKEVTKEPAKPGKETQKKHAKKEAKKPESGKPEIKSSAPVEKTKEEKKL